MGKNGTDYEKSFAFANIHEGIRQGKCFQLFHECKRCFKPFDDTVLHCRQCLQLFQLKHKCKEAESEISQMDLVVISTTGKSKKPFYLRHFFQVRQQMITYCTYSKLISISFCIALKFVMHVNVGQQYN